MTDFELWKIRYRRSFIFVTLYIGTIYLGRMIDFGDSFMPWFWCWLATVVVAAGLHWVIIRRGLDTEQRKD